jgi:hypothetical protein
VSIGDAGDAKSAKSANENIKYLCDECGKTYKSRNGLWKHHRKCLIQNKEDIVVIQNENFIVEKLTSLITNVIKQNDELVNKITTICQNQNNTIVTNTNNICNNNKTFNLNFFLNETCKNAMNMSEFINSLHIEYNDFERVGEIGFVNGISNIIIKNLKDLDIAQRPIHCTDRKREVVYVKEDNKWEKEDENFTKMRKLVRKAVDKNIRLLPEFKKKYPDCEEITSKYSDKYDLLVIETMGGFGDNNSEKEKKIIKNIAREVFINKGFEIY